MRASEIPIDVEGRAAELADFTLHEIGAWWAMVMAIWKEGPMTMEALQQRTGYPETGSVIADTKPGRLLAADSGLFSFPWLEVRRAQVEAMKERARENGTKGGRPHKRKRRTDPLSEITESVIPPENPSALPPAPPPVPDPETGLVIATKKRVKRATLTDTSGEVLTGKRIPPRARARITRTLLEDSAVNTLELFTFALSGLAGIELIDVEAYFRAAMRYSKSKGERRADWIETVIGWMERDKEQGKLKMKQTAEQQQNSDKAAAEYLNLNR